MRRCCLGIIVVGLKMDFRMVTLQVPASYNTYLAINVSADALAVDGARPSTSSVLGPHSLTWFDFNLSMDK